MHFHFAKKEILSVSKAFLFPIPLLLNYLILFSDVYLEGQIVGPELFRFFTA